MPPPAAATDACAGASAVRGDDRVAVCAPPPLGVPPAAPATAPAGARPDGPMMGARDVRLLYDSRPTNARNVRQTSALVRLRNAGAPELSGLRRSVGGVRRLAPRVVARRGFVRGAAAPQRCPAWRRSRLRRSARRGARAGRSRRACACRGGALRCGGRCGCAQEGAHREYQLWRPRCDAASPRTCNPPDHARGRVAIPHACGSRGAHGPARPRSKTCPRSQHRLLAVQDAGVRRPHGHDPDGCARSGKRWRSAVVPARLQRAKRCPERGANRLRALSGATPAQPPYPRRCPALNSSPASSP